jgi:beta-glucosidase
MRGGNGWQDAYAKAQEFVSQLTLLEKINLTTGVGWEGQPCVGNTGSIPRLNFPGKCFACQLMQSKHYESDIDYRTLLAGLPTWSS